MIDYLVKKVNGINKCCGSKGFNNKLEICCERNRPIKIKKTSSACCGMVAFNPKNVII